MSFLNNVEGLDFIIFYGSQLGQAQSIAEGLPDVAEEYELKTKALELNVIKDVNDLAKLNCPIVIITSTTGDGEPPENADKFWRKIRRKALSPTALNSVTYTILGLGDTNFNNFCNCGKEFNRRFLGLGASTFYPPAWADDAVGLESTIDDWIENLWPTLANLIHPDKLPAKLTMEKTALTVPSCPTVSLQLEWLEKSTGDRVSKKDLSEPLAPYPLIDGDSVEVKLKNARVLTKPDALKTSLELTFQFGEKSFKFEPGDSINVICPNPEGEIVKILERLKLTSHAEKTLQLSVKEGAKGKIPAFLPATVTLRDAFRFYLDIRGCPKKTFVRLLAEHTSDEDEKSQLLKLCSRQGSSDFESIIRFAALSLLDILLSFPSCMPPLEALLEHLPRLAPRAYSISSSPLIDDKSFTFVFNVVVIPKEDGRKYDRLGICTGWLAQKAKAFIDNDKGSGDGILNDLQDSLKELSINEIGNGLAETLDGDSIIIYKRKNQQFRLPDANKNKSPIVMVGPGTGVAPFVGFAQHRNRLMEKGENFGEMTLYYGCRHKSRDFLYEEELKLCQDGALTKFYPVFSRDDPEAKVKYVQHRMEENKEELVQTLFENGGYLYVCGDARNMAKDVRETLIRCLESIKGISEAEAKTLIAELTTQRRYLQDIWT